MALLERFFPLLGRRRELDIMASLEQPLRAELLGVERLEALARQLAESDQLLPDPHQGQPLLSRFHGNRRALYHGQRKFAEDVRRGQPLSPAAEWLLDNFYVVQNQFHQVEQDLTRGYYWELPKLAKGQYAGYPRVYGLALTLLAHADSRLDIDVLTRFIAAYQTLAPLTSGELWAVPIMVRVGLVENLRRLVGHSLATQRRRSDANRWANRLLRLSAGPPTQFLVAVADLAQNYASLDSIFVVHLLERLRDQNPGIAPVVHWLEEWLAERGTSLEVVTRTEHQRRAANRVSVGNVITSMRALSAIDWAEFFERSSLVEAVLRQDPARVYASMDFDTRDRYRHVVEKLSKGTGRAETEVAHRAVDLARAAEREGPRGEAATAGRDSRRAHVGYYLIERGRLVLEAEVQYRPGWGERLVRWARAHPTVVYLGAIGLVTALALAAVLAYAAAVGMAGIGLLAAALVTVLPASVLAISTVNYLATVLVPPRGLPKLEFRDAIPAEFRSMVVVPALVGNIEAIQQLFSNLEVRFLANRDRHLHFAVLGDFADAGNEHRPEDKALLAAAGERVRQLNERYGDGQAGPFFYFHRRRVWNPQERAWMGWERKRGKLLEFNRLLRGAADTSFVVQLGDLSILPQIKYIITLDADTELPIDSAKRLVGAMAHPLNRPRLDPQTGIVVEGYGILQPRTAVTALAATETPFARLFAGDTGLDPYSVAVSTVYQDLFGAGNYIGKAIYDVDTMLATVDGRFPENLLLSHDLLEGSYARAGHVTEVQLLEDFPSGYDAYIHRQHRWVRGDWQVAEWVLPWVPGPDGRRVRNPLPAIARWKFLDNLRQSLVPPAVLLLLLLGWTVLPGSPWVWSAIAVLTLFLPELMRLMLESGVHPVGEPWLAYFRHVREDAVQRLARALLQTAFLPYEALVNLDAILRVLVRRTATRRGLLEWHSAAVVERGQARTLRDYWARMWVVPALVLILAVLLLSIWPGAFRAALALLVLWFASPFLAYGISLPAEPEVRQTLPEEVKRELRLIARRTWRFYETFAGPSENWLPPDNYQVEPNGVVAHRTSPTNVGFLLLSSLAAYDFGYVSVLELSERLENTLSSLEKLERYRGHLLNWYDTLTLQPLHPRYVSTVDSGNLAASLLVLQQACVEISAAPIVRPADLFGLQDTARAMSEAADRYQPTTPRARAAVQQLCAELQAFEKQLRADRTAPDGWAGLLNELLPLAESMAERAATLPRVPQLSEPGELQYWSRRLAEQVAAQRTAIETLAPWTAATQPVPGNGQVSSSPNLPGPAGGGRSWPSLDKLAAGEWMLEVPAAPDGPPVAPPEGQPEHGRWQANLELQLQRATADAAGLRDRLQQVAERARALASAMDFGFLFNAQRGVFAIGYNLETQRLDNSYYDLLASEARLASFIAIAGGQAPPRHWFRLARPLTWAGGSLALLSWGGTMFEYLMPSLLMHDYEHTLLAQSVRAAVRAQRQYGSARRVPWGISESGFYAFDYQFNYQYQSFGAPELALKREPGDHLVIAPYATFLALHVHPEAAWANLRHLAREGGADGFGYYEAIDYTPSRRPRGQRAGIVRSYMAHHQGMSLLALDNYLNQAPMRRRFHSVPAIAAIELLLQERVPRHVPVIEPHPEAHLEEREEPARTAQPRVTPNRIFVTPHTLTPRTHVLSNGRYEVMVTNAGGGYSHFLPAEREPEHTLAITRWRPDRTQDNWGTFIYIKDVVAGQVWSAGYQPVGREPETYEVNYAVDRAQFRRRDFGIETITDVIVSAKDNIEIRRVTLTNYSRRPRSLAVTSYAEVVLDSQSADLAHPAFSKLFVESEYWPEQQALLFRRRPRAADQPAWWAMHRLTATGPLIGAVEFETDRARFLGRGGTARHPAAMQQPLSNTAGAVLDPVMSLRGQVRLAPGETVRLIFVSGIADEREGVVALTDRYSDPRIIDNAFDLSWVYSQIQLRHLGIADEDAHLFQRLASRVVYPDPALRAGEDVLVRNTRSQSALWAYGLSGDHPIVVIRIDESGELDLVRQLLHAHEYWRLNNFTVDLVILTENPATYGEELRSRVQNLIDTSLSRPWQDRPGGVFVRQSDHMPPEDRILLLTVARVVLNGDLGSLAEQLERSPRYGPGGALVPARAPSPARERVTGPAATERAVGPLQFDNGLGGFSPDGREYVIRLAGGRWTPLPWINVLANEHFGCLATDTGLGYTWSENSQLNRLTPWSNDPISDPHGEVLYLRDDETGELWTPTPLPIREADGAPYIIRHGAGYTRYERHSHGLDQEMLVYVPREDSLKVVRLRLRNRGRRTRQITATAYAEWVLGRTRAEAQFFIVTERDERTGALLARNTYAGYFSQRVAFACLDVHPVDGRRPRSARAGEAGSRRVAAFSFTTDRTEFIGRNGSLAQPAGLLRSGLSGRTGTGFDPCAALQARLALEPDQEVEVVFLLGQGRDRDQALALAERYREPERVQSALEAVRAFWDDLLGTVQVQTPDPAMDVLLNRWLLYQALVCRIWGRSAFYQSGGAYGYRDQLQDVMALVYARPDLTREHLLRSAAHQFLEGDVQHWWHPNVGLGVRTRFSDDYLWLPFVTHFYVTATGDTAVLDERVPYLKAPLLEPDQHEALVDATPTRETGSLYEHCCRAIDYGLRFGRHGLPLMGIGDWNDGMNRVGEGGEGESVWLGWFLYTNLTNFAELAEARGHAEPAERYRAQAARLQQALHEHGWDGAWYRRAYFDDGTPLGSAQNEECQIDSIAQSWAVLSGAAPPDRVQQAFAAAERYLVREADRLLLLLTPPFNLSQPDPGYIQGYVPGIRENGGQYTHAALWLILAYTELGQGDRAAELFSLINPVNHARNPAGVLRYKVEPYVIAADVYAHPMHIGRGGWTWYTGSSAWMYRVGLEGLLGVQRRGDRLFINPCIPAAWPGFRLTYRHGSARYDIRIENPENVSHGVARVEVDGQRQAGAIVPLRDDGQTHAVRVVMGPA